MGQMIQLTGSKHWRK